MPANWDIERYKNTYLQLSIMNKKIPDKINQKDFNAYLHEEKIEQLIKSGHGIEKSPSYYKNYRRTWIQKQKHKFQDQQLLRLKEKNKPENNIALKEEEEKLK